MNIKLRLPSCLYLSAALYICVLCLPVLQAWGTVCNMLIFLSFLIFLVGIFTKRTVNLHTIITILLITIFNYLIYKTQWTDYTTLANKMFMLFEFWFPAIFSIELFANKNVYNENMIRSLLVIFLVVYSITCITTIIGNMNYDTPSRWLATGALESSLTFKYRSENIGGFGFCYLIPFVAFLLTYQIKRTKKKILYIPLVLSYVCAIASQYMILILILIIMTIWMVFDSVSRTKKFVLMFAALVALMVVIANIDDLVSWLIAITENHTSLQRKIRDIYYTIRLGSMTTSSSVYRRLAKYKISWDLFLKNPLFGGGINYNSAKGDSEIIDLCGSMGLFGIALLIITLRSIWAGIQWYYSNLQDKSKKIVKLMLVSVLILAILNPILSSKEIGLVLFLTLAFAVSSDSIEENILQ